LFSLSLVTFITGAKPQVSGEQVHIMNT